jgi:hypothetical protein
MSTSVRRALAAAAAACTLGLLALVFVQSSSAPKAPKPVVPPVQTQNVIVIPSPDQVSNTTGASVCRWLKAGRADARPMSVDSGSSSALLLAAPLAAAEYAVNGMSGVNAVAGLYGC